VVVLFGVVEVVRVVYGYTVVEVVGGRRAWWVGWDIYKSYTFLANFGY